MLRRLNSKQQTRQRKRQMTLNCEDSTLQAMKEMNGKYVGNRPVKLMKSEHELRALEPGVKKEKPVKVAKHNFSLNLKYM